MRTPLSPSSFPVAHGMPSFFSNNIVVDKMVGVYKRVNPKNKLKISLQKFRRVKAWIKILTSNFGGIRCMCSLDICWRFLPLFIFMVPAYPGRLFCVRQRLQKDSSI